MTRIVIMVGVLFLLSSGISFAQDNSRKFEVRESEGEKTVETEEKEKVKGDGHNVLSIVIWVLGGIAVCVLCSPPVLMKGGADERIGNWCEGFGRD